MPYMSDNILILHFGCVKQKNMVEAVSPWKMRRMKMLHSHIRIAKFGWMQLANGFPPMPTGEQIDWLTESLATHAANFLVDSDSKSN